jgi:hypothetical protein
MRCGRGERWRVRGERGEGGVRCEEVVVWGRVGCGVESGVGEGEGRTCVVSKSYMPSAFASSKSSSINALSRPAGRRVAVDLREEDLRAVFYECSRV